jgi:outer membrane protein assembly factor BamB
MRTTPCLLALVLLVTSISATVAQEWTRFRGPNGSGISNTRTIPTSWTDSDFNWKTALPGEGHSSPVLWGEQIFLTTADEKTRQFSVLSFDAKDGRKLWQKDFPITPFRKHNFNSFASSTPTVDAERVYVCWTEPKRYSLVALDHHGKEVWNKDLGPFTSQHGGGTSPILYDGKVILGNDQDGESFLIAVDARTGETRWKTPRTPRASSAAYSTPCVYQSKNDKPVLIFTSEVHGISGIAPETGKVVWEYSEAFDNRTVSSPLIAGDFIVGASGSGFGGNYVIAVRPGDPAQDKKPEVAYKIAKSAPYVPTSVCVGDLLFLWGDGGIVSCANAKTGEIKWQERVGGNFFASPVWVDGRLFGISTSGEVVVISASDKFEVLARNALNELSRSTPAIANGRMYLRTVGHLLSVGGKTVPPAGS